MGRCQHTDTGPGDRVCDCRCEEYRPEDTTEREAKKKWEQGT
jgi:hypothetical protein